MGRVVVTGAASPLGREVTGLLRADDAFGDVVAVDLRPAPDVILADLATADLDPVFEGATSIVHLASAFGPEVEGPEIDAATDVVMARRVLEAADRLGVEQLVLLSTATVYGPWANNAVPLSEDAPIRPHPELAYAVQLAEVERTAALWGAAHPDVPVARLRPVPVVGDGWCGWLARALDAADDVPTADDTTAQYLHVTDLAAAAVAVLRTRSDGPVNVAPNGWLTPTERRALDLVPRLRLPEALAVKVASWRWRLRLAPTPPGILPYARHPWVVANDRLLATGWEPTVSNEEAYVVGHEPSALETISPQRRQELALGAMAAAGVAVVAGGIALVRRGRR